MAGIFLAGIIAAPFTGGISLAASAYAVATFSYYTAGTEVVESYRNEETQAMRDQIRQVSTQYRIPLKLPEVNPFEKKINTIVKSEIELALKSEISHNNTSNNTAGPKPPHGG